MLFSSGGECDREYADIGGAVVEFIRRDGRAFASRIITTDPDFYLDPKFSPGSDITDLVSRG